MKKHLSREIALLALSSAPILISFCILSVDADWARRFIKVQLVGASLSSWLTFGLAPVLSSLAIGSPLRPPNWIILLGALACPIIAVIMWVADQPDPADAALIASLTAISIIYRLPAYRITGRAVLMAQFLVIAQGPGRIGIAIITVLCLVHLAYLGTFTRSNGEHIGVGKLAHAYLTSVVKDFFYRGHYLVLSAFGLAGEHYASILRLLDISSRPTDYLFQRLVDEAQISSRLRHVAVLAPLSAVGLALMMIALPSFGWASWLVLSLTGACASLIVLTKYLAYEQNAMFRFVSMTILYLLSMFGSLPLALTTANRLPLPFFLGSLIILTLGLLIFRLGTARGIAQAAKMNRLD